MTEDMTNFDFDEFDDLFEGAPDSGLVPEKCKATVLEVKKAITDAGLKYLLFIYKVTEGQNAGMTVRHCVWLTKPGMTMVKRTLRKFAPAMRILSDFTPVMATLPGVSVDLEIKEEDGYTNIYVRRVLRS